jgi:hypothetical protein
MKKTGVSRRDVVKLAGAVAALGAGLGIVLDAADAVGAEESGRLQLKFFRLGDGGDEKSAQMLVTLKLSAEEESRILAVPAGRLQLKITMQNATGSPGPQRPTVLVKQLIPLDPSRVQGKIAVGAVGPVQRPLKPTPPPGR